MYSSILFVAVLAAAVVRNTSAFSPQININRPIAKTQHNSILQMSEDGSDDGQQITEQEPIQQQQQQQGLDIPYRTRGNE